MSLLTPKGLPCPSPGLYCFPRLVYSYAFLGLFAFILALRDGFNMIEVLYPRQ